MFLNFVNIWIKYFKGRLVLKGGYLMIEILVFFKGLFWFYC